MSVPLNDISKSIEHAFVSDWVSRWRLESSCSIFHHCREEHKHGIKLSDNNIIQCNSTRWNGTNVPVQDVRLWQAHLCHPPGLGAYEPRPLGLRRNRDHRFGCPPREYTLDLQHAAWSDLGNLTSSTPLPLTALAHPVDRPSLIIRTQFRGGAWNPCIPLATLVSLKCSRLLLKHPLLGVPRTSGRGDYDKAVLISFVVMIIIKTALCLLKPY